MRSRLSTKQQRALVLLVGMLEPTIFQKLRARGLRMSVHQHGWSLLQKTLAMRPAAGKPREEVLARLRELERVWITVAAATLEGHHPELHGRIFGGYARAPGNELLLVLRPVVDHLVALGKSAGPGGAPPAATADEQAAWALLVERGVDEALPELDQLLRDAHAHEPEPVAAEPEERRMAEEALWRFYREWSRIARTADLTRQELRRLGFLRGRRGEVDEPLVAAAPGLTAPGLTAPGLTAPGLTAPSPALPSPSNGAGPVVPFVPSA